MSKAIKIFIADDHQMFIDGIKSLLESVDFIEIVGEATNGNDLVQKIPTLGIDVVLLDIGMEELNGIDTAKYISEKHPEIHTIALTMFDDIYHVKKMLKAGAKGYILKNTSKIELLEAIQEVSKGKTYYSEQIKKYTQIGVISSEETLISKLTNREIEIIRLITKSMTNKEIAQQLFLSELTVNTHRKNAMHKLEIKNTAGLVKFALDNGL
ncbi:MAG: response regulator transcription factor [Flavobacteriia bacterium]|nr:response regulator transcription factor [Flavobacteriia bacterium]